MTIRNRTERGPPDGLHVLAVTFLPARAADVAQVVERLGVDPSASRAVVGAGRGLLARELTRLGFTVVALDPDADAVRLDEEASARDGLPATTASAMPGTSASTTTPSTWRLLPGHARDRPEISTAC